jgi:hypothetical protein
MTNLTLQLDADALRDATVQAMLGVLTPEVKAKMIETAIQAILRPSTDSWNRGVSPLETAFQRAIEMLANQECAKLIAEDEAIRTRVTDLLRKTADKVLNADVEKLSERMASAFVESCRKD